MIEVVGRWCAGESDWHSLPSYEIVLERTGVGWHVTYFAHGEPHALIGFDSESEARDNVEHLMSACPHEVLPWHEIA
ncbi:hypothetical protein AB0L13_02865 [Saccharopolyspora shandongensis]|uniref:hypothetical protein n=1 Tax=Saccharopolyspora shandongensis TaxID=418495 RepID=UPI0034487492